MPANTPQGYPYPLPTEPVAEGAQAIRNLAEAVKAPLGVVTALPASPADGQEISWLYDGTTGTVWRFRYRAASPSPYKWEFVGGSAYALNSGEQFATMNSYFGWRAMPSLIITVQRPGDYLIWGATRIGAPAAGSRQVSASLLKITGAGAGPFGNQATALISATNNITHTLAPQRVTATAGGDSYTLGVSDNSINDSAAYYITPVLIPVRIG